MSGEKFLQVLCGQPTRLEIEPAWGHGEVASRGDNYVGLLPLTPQITQEPPELHRIGPLRFIQDHEAGTARIEPDHKKGDSPWRMPSGASGLTGPGIAGCQPGRVPDSWR